MSKKDTAPKTFASRDAILSAQDMATEDVYVPQWDAWVRIRTLSGRERDAFEASLFSGEGKKRKMTLENLRARLVARACIDEEGNRLFTDADVDQLGQKSAAALDLLYSVAQRLNSLTEEDAEEILGNSERINGADSRSGSVSH